MTSPRSSRSSHPSGRISVTRGARDLILLWESPRASVALAAVVYATIASTSASAWLASDYAYYNYLADAFLHGELSLRLEPANTLDLAEYHGELYLFWPPFPALVLMPFVAAFGVGFSDVAFTIALGAVNVGLVAWLLRVADQLGLAPLTTTRRALLVMSFALGTVHLTMAPFGRVWNTGQLVAFACLALAYLAAMRLTGTAAFVATGLALAAVVMTRNPMLAGGLWPVYWLMRSNGWFDRIGRRDHNRRGHALVRRRVLQLVAGGLPVLISLGALAAYNMARFGDPLELGFRHHDMSPMFLEDYARYGGFDLHYVPTNFYYQYVYYPFPLTSEATMGGSLFLLTPVFFAALYALFVPALRDHKVVLLVCVALINLPIITLMGTGWMTFGPRYTLDFTLPLLLLTAMGLRKVPVPVLGLVVAVSVIHYVIGALFIGTIVSM